MTHGGNLIREKAPRLPGATATQREERVGVPFLLQGRLERTLIATPMRLASPNGIDGPNLLLLTDPGVHVTRDCRPALQLLGLTGAEARLAVLIGSGLSPRDAARVLDIAENTARTVLRTIYDKLSIRRQAQLASLVTRLAGP